MKQVHIIDSHTGGEPTRLVLKGFPQLAGCSIAEQRDALRDQHDQLLAALPDLPQMTTAKGVAQALNASGLFMESRLLAGQNPTLVPDLKANLLRVIAQILPGLPDNTSCRRYRRCPHHSHFHSRNFGHRPSDS